MELQRVDDQELLKGVSYPAGTRFREILVTGPPGSGKSTLILALGGWPEEGLIDLSAPGWWRSRELSARPREVHLALPFQGYPRALALHDPEWVERARELELAVDRIRLPGPVHWWADWRRRYLFDVQLPGVEEVLVAREARAGRGSHPGDRDIDPEVVRRQREAYERVAVALHRAGFRVVVRTEYGGPPRRFPDLAGGAGRGRWWLERLWRRYAGFDAAPDLDPSEPRVLRGGMVRIPRESLPVEADLGGQRVVIGRELRLDGKPTGRLQVYDPDRTGRLFGRLRLAVGESTRLGRGAEDRFVTRSLPADILPRLEIVNRGDGALLVDLDSPQGTEVRSVVPEARNALLRLRITARRRLEELFPDPRRPLPPAAARELLERVLGRAVDSTLRPPSSAGGPGGIVSLPDDLVPIVLGDLHTRIDHLLAVLTQNRFLDEIEAGRAVLVILGDAVHPETGPSLAEMESSMAIMDRILALIDRFPARVVYLLGNHDSFSPEVRKGSVPQGVRWRETLVEVRGEPYARAMETFYERSAYLLDSAAIVACHGGAPSEGVTRQELVDIADSPRLRHQLTWNRLRAANNPAGYTRRNVKNLLAALDRSDAAFVVSHTPPVGGSLFERDAGGIRGHHVIHSADPGGYSLATVLDGEVALLDFDAEPWGRWRRVAGDGASP